MIDFDDLSRAALMTPPPPPLEVVERRAQALRQRRRHAFAAAVSCGLIVLLGSIGLVVTRPSPPIPDATVSATDPLRRVLESFGPELVYEPAPQDALGIREGIVPGTFRVLGFIEGVPVALYDRPADEFGPKRPCIYAAGPTSEIEGCTRAPLPAAPSTSAVGGSLVWENVPTGAVAVGLRDLERQRWQRPQGSLVYFPILPGEAWFEFEIMAFAADGSVLASEFYRGGTFANPGATLRWRDAEGVLRSRNHVPEAPPSLPVGDPVVDTRGDRRGTTAESTVLPGGRPARVVREASGDFAGYFISGTLGFVDFDIATEPARLRELERCLEEHRSSTGVSTRENCHAAVSAAGVGVGH